MRIRLSSKVLNWLLLPTILLLLVSCIQKKEPTLFVDVPSSKSGIDFKNQLTLTEELNPYTYRNFYNGGGVAVGDINNDGLVDIYFTGNQVDNKLYLNKGDFKFEDITNKAGVAEPGVWSTGAQMVDLNGDGLLDIYVTKSGSPGGPNRANELFINNGDLTFTKRAKEYGLDVEGLSTDAVFFDYDRDGDLDMYLLNNSLDQLEGINVVEGIRNVDDPNGGDQLFRNDVDADQEPTFINVTNEAGIYSSKIGFGLDAVVSDLNMDGWLDIYVSNDFFERDYLYLNNRDGTFSEVLPEVAPSISLSSMGADIADINHDGRPDIFITDMLPEEESRVKSKTTFDSWSEYQKRVEQGYHHQFVRNSLLLNNGFTNSESFEVPDSVPLVNFSEVSRLTNTEATDWSWSTLIADYNNDGHNDIYVTNCIIKDLTDQDYVNDRMNMDKLRSVVEEGAPVEILFDEIPSTPISNYVFAGSDSLHFSSKAKEWGLTSPGFSSGATYADLDNDGDLDIVVNNNNANASLYKNDTGRVKSALRWLTVQIHGSGRNTSAIGAEVNLWAAGKVYYREQMPGRGFQSSVDHRIHFGLGKVNRIDSLEVFWPDGQRSVLRDIGVNQMLTIKQDELPKTTHVRKPHFSRSKDYRNITSDVSIDYQHKENEYIDFERNSLLRRKYSTEGPPACIADLNGDDLDDLYLGGAKGQAGGIYIQGEEFDFRRLEISALEADKGSEDTGCAWFDANGDGKLDLYVSSGGSEFPASSSALADRLYIGSEGMNWQKAAQSLPLSKYEAASVVKAADFNQDGHTDLFTGTRLRPFAYGLPVNGNLLLNDGSGNFENVTKQLATSLIGAGLITDAAWFDYDRDGDLDLAVAGEWMPIKVFENQLKESGKVQFAEVTKELNIGNTHGLWQSLEVADLDGDGYHDMVAGNMGTNQRHKASSRHPLRLWVNDFDENGSIDQIETFTNEEGEHPMILRDDLLNHIPSLAQQIPDYKSFSQKTIQDLFPEEKLKTSQKLKAEHLESAVFWNNSGHNFELHKLPMQAQFAPTFGIAVDSSEQSYTRILAGGNLYGVKPELGRQDASYGSVIEVVKDRLFQYRKSNEIGFELHGEVRGIHTIKSGDKLLHLVLRNNDKTLWFIKDS